MKEDANMIKVGDKVEAGKGEDHDTGRVVSIDDTMAFVSWDSGVATPCPIADLSKLGE